MTHPTHPTSPASAKRLPAYAKPLVSLRMAGYDPLYLNVIFGNDWSPAKGYAERARAAQGRKLAPFSPGWVKAAGWPSVVVPPRDYAPGEFDFRFAAGIHVTVQDQDCGWHEIEGPQQRRTKWGPLYYLIGELAQWAACVMVVSPDVSTEQSADLLAYCERSLVAGSGRYAWPAWWSQQLDEEYGKRSRQWFADLAQFHRQHGARAA